MFEFGRPSTNDTWFYEGPRDIVAPGVNTGSIETSTFDSQRQGVELSSAAQWAMGTVKIHAGETGHRAPALNFGVTEVFDPDLMIVGASWYREKDYLDPVTHLKATQTSYNGASCSSPSVLLRRSNNDAIRAHVYNGVIEPLDIRTTLGVSFHTTNGAIMAGNVDCDGGSEQVLHVSEFDPNRHCAPYVDKEAPVANITPATYEPDYEPTIKPFDDKSRIKVQFAPSNVQHVGVDMLAAISQLEPDTDSYIPSGSIAATAGFVYDSSLGTDSLAFGGMTY